MAHRQTNAVGGGSASVTIASWEHPAVWEFVGKGRYLQAAFCKSAVQLYSAKFGSFTLRSLSNVAAEGASIGLLEWSKEIGCCWDESVFRSGARGGSVVVLEFLEKNDCPIQRDAQLCTLAGAGGHLEGLQFLRRKCGCVWDKSFCEVVAKEGRLKVLQYAHAQQPQCPDSDSPGWKSRDVCMMAARMGYICILAWAHKTLQEENLFDAKLCEAAARGGRLTSLQYLRSLECEWDGRTCEVAVMNGHVGVLKWALDNGCPWAVNDRRYDGETGLHYALNAEVMEFLLSRGANINAVDEHGRTPLYAAVRDGLRDAAAYLVRAGADVNIADVNGLTPLAVAIDQETDEIAAMLRDAGAR